MTMKVRTKNLTITCIKIRGPEASKLQLTLTLLSGFTRSPLVALAQRIDVAGLVLPVAVLARARFDLARIEGVKCARHCGEPRAAASSQGQN